MDWLILVAVVGAVLWLHGVGCRAIYPEIYKRGRRVR